MTEIPEDKSSNLAPEQSPRLAEQQTYLMKQQAGVVLQMAGLILQMADLLAQQIESLSPTIYLWARRVAAFTKRHANIITTIVLTLVVMIILLNFYDVFTLGLQPAYSDELSYYKNLQSFSENRSAGVPIAYDLSYSNIGAYSSHGPFYTVFYGIVPILFGPIHPQWMLIQNTILCLAAMGLGWSSVKLTLAGKNMVAIVMATNLVFVTYIHLFMVEAAHIFAVALLGAIILKTDTRERRGLLITSVVIAAFVLSLTRISWIALYALAPVQCRSRRAFALTVLASAVALAINFWVYGNFFASYEDGFLHQLFVTLDKDGIFVALKVLVLRFAANLELYRTYWDIQYSNAFGTVYITYKALYILVFLVSGYLAWHHKDRVLMGMILVNILTLMALMFLYDAYSWREHRSLNTIYILNIILMVRHLKFPLLAYITIIQLLCLYTVFQYKNDSYREYGTEFRQHYAESTQLISDLTHIKKLPVIEDDDLVTIGAGIDIVPQRKSVFLLEMPVQNNDGARIRYSMAVNRPLQAEGHDYVLEIGPCTLGSLYRALPSFNICTTGTPK